MEKTMKASILDLRYRMKQVLQALDRNEEITILYHGKEKGVILPRGQKKNMTAAKHPFFGMSAGEDSVEGVMNGLRGRRDDAL